jgi:hypothetical protein
LSLGVHQNLCAAFYHKNSTSFFGKFANGEQILGHKFGCTVFEEIAGEIFFAKRHAPASFCF